MLSIKFLDWFLLVCKRNMWSFIVMADWSSCMESMSEETRAPNAGPPYILSLPQNLRREDLKQGSRTVLLMTMTPNGDIGLT